MTLGETRCPSCGEQWSGAHLNGGGSVSVTSPVCEACARAGPSRQNDKSLEDAPTEALTDRSAPSAEPTAPAAASSWPAPPASPGLEPSSGGPPLDLDDASVGGHATISPSAVEGAVNWQEGSLVADRFRIIKFVGQGGMGKVFLGQDETLNRPIALKCVPQEIIFDGDARDDLRQEASRLLDLAHENIVRIHTYYDGPTWPFFAMEYLEGPTLKRLLRQRKQSGRAFSAEEVLIVARQVARGLAHAHAKGIIHRDLKPGNLMLAAPPGETLREADLIKITDFGVSRVLADSTLRQTGKRSGTIPYMSPEQFRGEPCTAQSDIYSFACTLYECLEGQPPFHTGDVGYQILHKPPPPVSRAPRLVAEAILRGLAKQPQDRFLSVDAFVQALHGELRPRNRVESIVRALVAVVLPIGLVTLALSFLPAFKRADQTPSPVARAAVQMPTETEQRETGEFLKRLREELSKQIPLQIGRNFRGGVSTRPDMMTIRFSLPEPRSSSHERSLFEQLVLLYTGDEAHEKKGLVRGKIVENAKVFELLDLVEGLYSVRAYLERGDKNGVKVTDPFLEEPHKFRVDLTPPSFEVLPVQPEAFIDASPPLRLTFYEVVDLKLQTAREPADIVEAYTALVLGEATRPWEQLTKLPSWRVELPPGVTTTYRVYARDAAGNTSAALEVSLRRLRLDVESFGLAMPDGVSGNLATVNGVLRVEGDHSPTLEYFVNDRLVEPESKGVGPLDIEIPSGGLLADPSGIPFSAVLKLPSASNTIEVRYAWRENPPQPFARPMRVSDVKVRPPQLVLDPPPRRTALSRLKLSGSLDPFFDGLELGLEQRGQGSQRVELFPAALSKGATFSQEVQLLEGENTFLLTFFYRGAPLVASQQSFSIYSDKVPPGLDATVRFEPNGDLLFTTIRPSEDLAELRVEEVAGPGKSGAWRVLERDPGGRTYTYSFPIPLHPLTIRLEMTDLVGLIGRSEHLCPITRADLEGVGFTRALRPPSASQTGTVSSPGRESGGARPEPATLISRESGVTVIRSPLLKELGLEFVPCGQERLEVSRTEVCERAWYLFLDERGFGYHGAGQTTAPMVLEGYPPETLKEFVKWFEERSNDGYVYSIPTRDEWIKSFAGVNDAERARQVVTDWFRGAPRTGPRFDSSPGAPYGTGEAGDVALRKESRSPSLLLDMEANVAEIVDDQGELRAIGGTNADRGPEEMLQHSLEARPLGAADLKTVGRLTGFRMVRRPAGAQ